MSIEIIEVENKSKKKQEFKKTVYGDARTWLCTFHNPFYCSSVYSEEIEKEVNELSFAENKSNFEHLDEYNEIFDFKDIEELYLHHMYPFTNLQEFQNYMKGLNHYSASVCQLEQAATGTIHIQFYIEFSSPKTFKTVKEYFYNNHVEPRKKTKEDAVNYCSKEETRFCKEPLFDGKHILTFGNLKWAEIKDMLEEGKSHYEIQNAHTDTYARCYKGIEKMEFNIKQYKLSEIKRTIKAYYIYSKNGFDIEEYILNKFQSVYVVNNYKRPFEDYNGEETILFNYFLDSLDVQELLSYLSTSTKSVDIKFGKQLAAYTKVIIASFVPFIEQYRLTPNKYEETTYDAFKRQLKAKIAKHIDIDTVHNKELDLDNLMSWYELNKAKQTQMTLSNDRKIKLEPVEEDDLPF